MATPIKPIPLLTGETAINFNKIADLNLANRKHKTNRSEDIASLKAILKKAKL